MKTRITSMTARLLVATLAVLCSADFVVIAQSRLPRVHVIGTGGTISGGASGSLVAVALVDAIPELGGLATITTEDFSSIGSSRMTPELQLSLSERIRELMSSNQIDGFVVTHGTDSLEETAFLLDLTLPSTHPVVFAAAQRAPRQIDTDGPRNLLNAIRLASRTSLGDIGVIITLNDTIHAARDVRKTHSIAVEAFVSVQSGPLGYIDDSKIYLFHRPLRRVTIRPASVESRVELITLVAGSGAGPIDDATARGVRGLVIEVFGRGNVPPDPLAAIARARAAKIPVVFVTRTGGGRVAINRSARELGVVSGENLDGLKARIAMCVGLGAKMTEDELQGMFRKLSGELDAGS